MLCTGCGRFGNSNKNNTDGKERIVCISKQYNEIIFALGAQKDLVAVDLTSTYPAEIKKLPTVGYHRALTTEGILSQKPTIILEDNNIGPETVIKQLNELKIPMKSFDSKAEDMVGVKVLIKEMGAYFNKNTQADLLCSKLDKDMEAAIRNCKKYTDTPSVLIIHFGQASNNFLVMTDKSVAARMVEWAGGKMSVTDVKGMKQLSAEVVASSNPDVILLTDFGYDRLGSVDKIKELPGLSGTKAATDNRIYRIEEHDLVYLGPRTGENVLAIQKLIHKKKP